jgi:predicted metal-binding protein
MNRQRGKFPKKNTKRSGTKHPSGPQRKTGDLEPFIKRALTLGADDAKVIDAATIATAPWVRLKCRFGCDLYNEGHCCPPNTPTPQEMHEVIACYKRALLIHCKGVVGPSRIAVEIEREIFLAGFYKALGLGAGPCGLCKRCPPKRCAHPDQARPSMEACGIDVFATVRANGYPIEVLPNSDCRGNYYGLVLID